MHKGKVIKKAETEIQPWKLLSSKELLVAAPWVKVYADKIKLPNGRIVDDYYRIELPEYVMIYAQDNDGKILFERQYKHALGEITFVLPTGCVEDGESVIEGGKRELLEETGYVATTWRYIGSFLVDGNKGCGKAHLYVAKDLEKIAEPIDDDMEQSEVVFIDKEEAEKSVFKGEIQLLATVALIALASHPAYLMKEDR